MSYIKEKPIREWNFDLYRCLALVFLIILHLLMHYDYNNIFYMKYLFSMTRSVIMMFILISGYFLFSYPKKELSFSSIFHRIKAIFIPLIYFYTIYYIINHAFYGAHYHYLRGVLQSNPEGPGAGILWYLYSLIPVAFLSTIIKLPLLDTAKKAVVYNLIILAWFLLIVFVRAFGLPFDPYINTFLLIAFIGYGVGNKYIKIRSNWAILLFFILWQVCIFISTKTQKIAEFQPTTILQLVSFYLFIKHIPQSIFPKLMQNIISYIANYSLPIYGWHAFFNDRIVPLIINNITNRFLSFIISLIIIFGGALTFGVITSKIFSLIFRKKITL